MVNSDKAEESQVCLLLRNAASLREDDGLYIFNEHPWIIALVYRSFVFLTSLLHAAWVAAFHNRTSPRDDFSRLLSSWENQWISQESRLSQLANRLMGFD